MSNVRSLVGIDAGVLDQNLAVGNVMFGFFVGGERHRHRRPIDAGVNVAGACDLEFLKAFDGTQSGDNFICDLARSPAQFLG